MIDGGQLLGAGVLVGLVAALWSRLKTVGAMALSRLVVRLEVDEAARDAVQAYTWRHFRRAALGGARRYGAYSAFVRPVGRRQEVAYEGFGTEPLVFWRGWRPLVVRMATGKVTDHQVGSGCTASLWFLRGTFDPDALVADAVAEHNAELQNAVVGGRRYRVRHLSGTLGDVRRGGGPDTMESAAPPKSAGYRDDSRRPDRRLLRLAPDDLGEPIDGADPVGRLALPAAGHELVAAGRRWLGAEKWYKARRVPWRMGWLLYGSPGNGKSSLVRAIAQELDLPVFAFDLATMSNRNLQAAWGEVAENAPAVALFEDIDAVFDRRKNVTNAQGGATFDCLLNLLSGVGDSSGVLTVVTTNRVEMLDDALGRPDPARGGFSTRPGRIDRAVELPPPDEAGRRLIAARILADAPDLIAGTVAAGAGDSGAQFEDRCARLALARYWAAPGNR